MARFQQTNRRRVQIDPKTLRKHSQVHQKRAQSILVTGRRERTETGFIVPGYSGKGFETYFETLLSGTATALFQHPKKTKTVRITGGSGVVVIDSDSEIEEKPLQPGDEIVLKAGTAYRFSTTSGNNLEMFVSQDSKYSARLETLESPTAPRVTPDSVLQPAERTTAPVITRRGSKAKLQQLEASGQRIESSQVVLPTAVNTAVVAETMNAKPSMGNFTSEGAG